MEAQSFIEAITAKVVDAKEIKRAVDALKQSEVLAEFLSSSGLTAGSVSPSQVQMFLMQTSIKLIDKRIPMQLVKNIYNEYSVIFAICALQKTMPAAISKKLQNIFVEIIRESATFDIYYKANVRLKKIAPTMPMEFFWLIPLLRNAQIFKSVNYLKFVDDCVEIAQVVPDYAAGYEYYIKNFSMFDKAEYKLYLQDGVKTKRAAEATA